MVSALIPITALLSGTFVLVLGTGLLGTLLPLRASINGFVPIEIGLIGGAYFLGFIAGCVLGPVAIRRVGHIRTFTAFAAIAGATTLVHAMVPDAYVWAALRAAGGVCFAGLYTVIESWLNERASNENRGRIFSTYQVIALFATMGGQFLLNLSPPDGYQLFSVAAILMSLALVPVALSASAAPAPIGRVRIRLAWLYRTSPVGVVGCLLIGLANGGLWALAPLFAQRSGMDVSQIAGFMAAIILGGALLQWPAGRLSDHVDRRIVIAASCLCAAGVGVAMALTAGGPALLQLGLAGAYGGFALGLYAICVAHANDYVGTEDFVDVSSGLLLTFGLGATFGPLIAAAAMEWAGIHALFLYTAAVHGALAVFVIYRRFRRAPVPVEERDRFVAQQPGRSPVVTTLDPRGPEMEEAAVAPDPAAAPADADGPPPTAVP